MTGTPSFREVLAERVMVADGAMGTMLQARDVTMDDFQGHEGCNEMLNVTRPDIVRAVHEAYFEVGVDCVETNTFGANLSALGEYDISERVFEYSEAGARVAREAADAYSTPERPRFVLGSIGPGTKLPTLGHKPYAQLRDAYYDNAAGLVGGGADALIIETSQDLLQVKAAVIGARRAIADAGRDVPVIAQVTIETNGAMLLGSEIARGQARDGAHMLDLCVDYVGRDGVADMRELAFRFATASTLPVVLDSTEPAVIEAGLQMLGGRAVVNSVNYEEGDGPETRFHKNMTLVREYGAAVVALTIDERGQARTADLKAQIALRLIEDLTGSWGMNVEDILVDMLTFPIATGQEETRRDALETIEAIKESKAEELAALPLWERLKRRIVDGERKGLEADLDEGLARRLALEIVNDVLLDPARIGVELSEEFQLHPEQSTSALIVHHPEANYFNV